MAPATRLATLPVQAQGLPQSSSAASAVATIVPAQAQAASGSVTSAMAAAVVTSIQQQQRGGAFVPQKMPVPAQVAQGQQVQRYSIYTCFLFVFTKASAATVSLGKIKLPQQQQVQRFQQVFCIENTGRRSVNAAYCCTAPFTSFRPGENVRQIPALARASAR